MENYIVSARKYRPSTFDQVIGQQSLTTTLKNAIASGKLAHAYLFCGPRGVGKTTCARIFAKTINCLHPLPNGEACNECESCRAFNEQRSYNIRELDAASNNSVDDIRALVEEVRIPPQIGRYKVFIIDEVHMLSTQAFNAFLKTLEEPPAHAIFILATTEKHKILPTILSRCQIYDFNRMGVNDIVNHLKYVAEDEGIKYEPDALNVIAQKADGAMRDALSIFDQVASFTGGNVEYQKVLENLNVLDSNYYFKLTDFFLEHKVPEAMLAFNEILNKGFEGSHFITGLASHLRNLLVSKDSQTLSLLEVSDQVRARYQTQSQKCSPKFLYRAIKLCNDCDLNYRVSNNKRLLIELTLIEVAQLSADGDDDGGAGLRPTKILKPLFKQQVAAPQPTARGHVSNGKSTPTAPPSSSGARRPTNSVAPVQHDSPLPREEAAINKIPTFGKSRIRISIHNSEDVSENEQPKNINPSIDTRAQKEVEEEDSVVTEKDVIFHWREYTNLLPAEQRSTAGRMQIMTPKLLNDSIFEIVVENPQVQSYMEQEAPKIERFLREKLHNKKLKMQIRIAEHEEVGHAYTNREMFDLMSKQNPTLAKLAKEFGLELT